MWGYHLVVLAAAIKIAKRPQSAGKLIIMGSTGIPTPTRVYQDYEPSMEWVLEDDSDTLLVYLPGFSKEQLRVQLISRNLIISGERNVQHNTWSRFRIEFPVSANCYLNKISAKFEGNILFVKQPKQITPAPKPEEEEEEKAPVVAAPPMATPQKLVVESNSDQKTLHEKPNPTTQSNIENKEVQDDPKKTEAEEKSEKSEPKTNENTLVAKTTDLDNKNKVVLAELDKTTKRALENYKRAVGVFATKLKTSRNAVNSIVVLLVGLVIGIYLSDSIKSWTKA